MLPLSGLALTQLGIAGQAAATKHDDDFFVQRALLQGRAFVFHLAFRRKADAGDVCLA